MPNKKDLLKASNSFMLAILIAGACGGFLTGLLWQAYRMKDFSIASTFEVVWFGFIMMIFGAPWVLIPLAFILCPFALALYFILPKIMARTKINFILISCFMWCALALFTYLLGWYGFDQSLKSAIQLTPTFIAAMSFGYFFHKFSQKAPD